MERGEKIKQKRVISIVEIVVLTLASVSFAYIMSEGSDGFNSVLIPQNEQNKYFTVFGKLYRVLIENVFSDKTFVSAATGVYTCLEQKDGSICQEFASQSECSSACEDTCIPSSRDKVAQCKLGTCYDKVEGTCQAQSPKAACESGGGEWNSDPNANIPQCRRGCCVIGEQTFFSTTQECSRKASVLGVNKEFLPEVDTELACLILSNSQEEGACVFEYEFENTCKFTTKSNCLEIGGNFYSGYLCSNEELNTNCEPQKKAECLEDKDEIYWFDSCGNRENIYDADKVKSYNDGKVLPKSESCDLGSSSNPLANQKTCGNCNYLVGSRCGVKTSDEKLADNTQSAVCRDLRCKTESGEIKENGESWCAYNSAIGLDKGSGKGKLGEMLRSIDTPGSRHYRQVCIDGEIRTEGCADFRNEICVEAQSPLDNGKDFSSAACRINRWQQCLAYNNEVKGKGEQRKQTEQIRDDKCTANSDCFIKEINIDKNFKFNICAPKYPAGFDLASNGEASEQICSMASQTCTVIYVKTLSGWKCKANCNCRKAAFAEQMNDLCMSLGDCGASVNYQGDFTENYKVSKSPKLGAAYLAKIRTYDSFIKGKFAPPANASELFLGIPDDLGIPPEEKKDSGGFMGLSMGQIAGAAGAALPLLAKHLPGFLTTAGYTGVTSGTVYTGTVGEILTGQGLATQTGPVLNALGNAIAGALIVYSVVSMIQQYAAIGDTLAIAALVTVVVATAAIYAAVGTYAGVGGFISGVIPILGIVLLVFTIVMSLLGIGKTKKVKVTFSCNPWQPPLGGAKCDQCGSDVGNALGVDKLPCSKYACQSLGQTCEFINEGTGQELCVDVSPDDASAPVIKPLDSALQPGFSYQNVNNEGFKIRSSEENGCVKAFSALSLGIQLNEPGQCRMDVIHTPSFEDMEFDFGGRSLFMYNHSMVFSVPSLESLGVSGFDPNRQGDYSLYVRCQDKSGNKNVREYTINFCVKPGDDLTPPVIVAREPKSEWIKYGTEELEASIFVNEPSECKWDVQDKDYDFMSNSMSCNTDLEDPGLLGWQCDSKFPVGGNDSTIYIRCKDQPWLIEDIGTGHSSIIVNEGHNTSASIIEEYDEDADNINQFEESDFEDPEAVGNTVTTIEADSSKKRNKNMESYKFLIKKSKSELKIDYIKPNNETIIAGTSPVSVDVELKTSGGVDGTAKCSYSLGGPYIEFFNTLSQIHSQTFESFDAGNKMLPVRCEDIAGNVAEATGRFTIFIDTVAPKITRVYEQSGTLIVVTDEEAQCYYSLEKCNFDINNATVMSSNGLVNSLNYQRNLVHYVKCKDNFGNAPGICSLAVKGGSI